MLVTGIASLQIMLDKGQEDGWFSSHFIVTLAVLAVVCLTVFVIWELRAKYPLVHFRLLRFRTFAVGASLSAVLGFVLFGSIVLLPLFMQELLGFPAITAGFWNSPRGIATLLLMPLAGFLIGRRWDMRAMMFAGLLISAVGIFWFSFLNLDAGPWSFVWPQIFMGAGLAFVFPPLATITVDPIPSEEMGYATSITSLMRNVGASIGISFAATWLARSRQRHQTLLVAHLTAASPAMRNFLALVKAELLHRGSNSMRAGQQALAMLYQMTLRQAAVLSYLDAFRLLGIFFIIVAPLPWLMHRAGHKVNGSSD
jgi:DHA2 family multidrug resistance protein